MDKPRWFFSYNIAYFTGLTAGMIHDYRIWVPIVLIVPWLVMGLEVYRSAQQNKSNEN